jgi:hypothetical protein
MLFTRLLVSERRTASGRLQKRYLKKIPISVGEYALNILDENGPFVTKEKPLL